MNPLPRILVIIVTWNKKEYILNLLGSLETLQYPSGRIDIVVVDNASDDGTVKAVEERFPHVHLIANGENLGGCGGFNTGLRWAFSRPAGEYDYLWLLDNDVLVHKNCLAALVTILEENSDVAVAGSTMMQLTAPWRINEMGAFVDRGRGTLFLNRHRQKVPRFRGRSVDELLTAELDLSRELEHCRPWMDVEYVAAASLLVRAEVAREAGLWEDFFIHFDDVEWCLRIAAMGHRIAVSARSIIWHLPGEAKVPTWILYYDNRNVLYLLSRHSDEAAVRGTRRWILKKALYYTLLGKTDLADLLVQAVQDFDAGRCGKKEIRLAPCYSDFSRLEEILADPAICRILLPWTVNLQAAGLQSVFVEAMRKRPELRVDYLLPAPRVKNRLIRQLPGSVPWQLHGSPLLRLFHYFRRRGDYDLVIQSDYQQILPLSWLGKKLLFVNYENMSLRQAPQKKEILTMIRTLRRLR